MKLKKPTPKLKGIHMMAQFYEVIILGRNADIQKGRKGQSLKQSLDEVAEKFNNPIIPYIENYDEVHEMLTPVMFQIHGNPKTKPALVRSLFHTLLLMARDKNSGSWVAQVAFSNYLALNEVNSAKPFVPLLKTKNDAKILHSSLIIDEWEYLEPIAPIFNAKIRLLQQARVNVNSKFQLYRWDDEKTTIAQELAKTLPEEDNDKEATAYLWMLKSAHLQGVDLSKGLKLAEEEGNRAFNSFVMKLKLDKDAKPKPEVSRVAQDGGKI
ncbi:hypothetical protein [Burkholderia cenocepacia]|uniref:hypothetical protein n=1 Tax=Burkholderia cenocepacia TaxID=95486 RepID=UPI0022371AF5|nr:hypothetical protein [Burkholderia cenocepacia]MCW5156459.1 hypothetical protein [Burkholderia cenocepacia]